MNIELLPTQLKVGILVNYKDIGLILLLIITGILISCYSKYSRKKGRKPLIETFLLAVSIILLGALIVFFLWGSLNNEKELFSALCELVIFVLTITFTFIQYHQTLEDKKESERRDARPEIINPDLSYDRLKKEIILKFTLSSIKKQPVMDVSGEIFLSFDDNAEKYNPYGHFDNIGTKITGERLEGKIDPFKHKSKYDKMRNFIDGNKTFHKSTGFEYLIYFRTRELENGVAVYLHGTNGYMAYYSDKDETWYKYDQSDEKISSKHISIINRYKP